MNIDVRVPFDSDPVSDMNVPGPVDYDSRFDVDIFSVGPERKLVLEINEGIQESLLFHAVTFLSEVAEKRPSAAFLSSLVVVVAANATIPNRCLNGLVAATFRLRRPDAG